MVQNQRIFWKVKCPSLQDKMKDAALFKLSLFWTGNSQDWDKKKCYSHKHDNRHTLWQPHSTKTILMTTKSGVEGTRQQGLEADRAQTPAPPLCV